MTDNLTSILLATRNPGKIRELEQLLSDLPLRLVTVDTLEDAPEVAETARSLQGNAVKKAQILFNHTGIPALADDTGLLVDALSGAPGVHSARFAGEKATDQENRTLLLSRMDGVTDRAARFCTVAAFVDDGGIYVFEGVCEGAICTEEAGEGGFGYDSVFRPDGKTLTFAQMPVEAKNAISHRGRALEKFRSFVVERVGKPE